MKQTSPSPGVGIPYSFKEFLSQYIKNEQQVNYSLTAYIGECCDLVLSGKEGVGVGCLRATARDQSSGK
mgnify:CR=1 FL=1